MNWRVVIAGSVAVVIITLSLVKLPIVHSSVAVPEDLNTGPYVDKLSFRVIPNRDQRMIAIQAGEIEMDTGFIEPRHLPAFGDPDIDIFSALRNGYGDITINCGKYPLNVSAFRRAFAFAFDKTRVTAEIMDGFSQEHDSLLPTTSGWCIEDELDWHYYTKQAGIGNQLLDAAGFMIDSGTGYRLSPDGSPFSIIIEYQSADPEMEGGVASIAQDALRDLHVDANVHAYELSEFIDIFDSDYDMVIGGTDFRDTDVQWLGYEFWSDPENMMIENPSNFINVTYDSWRNNLLHGTTYEEVFEASAEMQKILHYNVPRLVVYENTYMQMYRNDRFKGHVGDLVRHISGPWTMRNIRLINGAYGGTVKIGITEEFDTFNIFVRETGNILDNLYSSLYQRNPKQQPVGDLGYNLVVETHSDNPTVPEGHTRFTMNIIENATWSDGVPLTAEDVAFTFNYILESARFGNPLIRNLEGLQSAVSLGPYRMRLEFDTESYWFFNNFAYMKIIPKHIFNDNDGIGFDRWSDWNPVIDPDTPQVTSGPFILTQTEQLIPTYVGPVQIYNPNQTLMSYELIQNPKYHWNPQKLETFLRPKVQELTFIIGSLGNTLQWTSLLPFGGTYTLHLNSAVIDVGIWDSSVTRNIDELNIGTYEFTLEVVYEDQKIETSKIVVHVVEEPPLPLPLPQRATPLQAFSIFVSVISVQVIAWAVVVSYQDKKEWNRKLEMIEKESKRDYFEEVFGS
ncbi:MAG: hypothetical protein E3J86_13705 [Candidatus Thorarchaeota archaeon]|nr:MAG: hypothetical protein E3J86_13705 [Candidatus Thorarchaeota archaeon]